MARPRFSLFNIHQRAAEESAGLPAILAAARAATRLVSHGGHQRRRAGTGENFWQFRDYHTGDRPQDIDWRQSGRTDRVFIRERELQTAQPALFWCANDPGMRWRSDAALPEKREAALILLTALMLLMHEGGEAIGVFGGDRPMHGAASVDTALLTLFNETNDGAIPNAPMRNRPFIVAAGDFLQPPAEFKTTLDALGSTAAGGLIVQVLDSAEINLPYAGRVTFESPAGAERYPIDESASVRDAYNASIADHIKSIADICAHHGWTHILHRTDQAPRVTLGEILQQLEHKTGRAA